MSCTCPRFYAHRTEFRKVPENEYDPKTCYPGAMIFHASTCLWGAGLTGGEYQSRAEHEEGRAAVDESMALDFNTLRDRERKGEA